MVASSRDDVAKAVEQVQKQHEARVEFEATRPSEPLYSYDVTEAGEGNGRYVYTSQRRNNAPVYRNGQYTLSRERPSHDEPLGWILGDTRPLYGVMTDSLSVPGLGWQELQGQGKPYVTWQTIEDGVRDLKSSGNVRFQRDVREALEFYSKALDLAEKWEYREVDAELVATLKSNRAECYLRLGDNEAALADASAALPAEKAYCRQARALRALKQYEQAASAYAAAARLTKRTEHIEAYREVKALGEATEAQRRALEELDLRQLVHFDKYLLRGSFERILECDDLRVLEIARKVVDRSWKSKVLKRRIEQGLESDDARSMVNAVHLASMLQVGHDRLASIALSTPKQLKLKNFDLTKKEWLVVQRLAVKLVKRGDILSLLAAQDPEIVETAVGIAKNMAGTLEDERVFDMAHELVSCAGELATYEAGKDELVYYRVDALSDFDIEKAAACLGLAKSLPQTSLWFVVPLLHAPVPLAAVALRLVSSSDVVEAARLGAHLPLLALDSPNKQRPLPTQIPALLENKRALEQCGSFLNRCSRYPKLFEGLDESRLLESLCFIVAKCDAACLALANVLAAKPERAKFVALRFVENTLVPLYQKEHADGPTRALRSLLAFESYAENLAEHLLKTRGNHDLLYALTTELAPPQEGEYFVSAEAKTDSLLAAREDVKIHELQTILDGRSVLEFGRLAGLLKQSLILEPCPNARQALVTMGFTVVEGNLGQLPTGRKFDVILLAQAAHDDWHQAFLDLHALLNKGGSVMILDHADAAFVIGDDAAQAGFVEDDLSTELVRIPHGRDLLVFRPEDAKPLNFLTRKKVSEPKVLSLDLLDD